MDMIEVVDPSQGYQELKIKRSVYAPRKVVRINSAISVESCGKSDDMDQTDPQIVKRCTCLTKPDKCVMHPKSETKDDSPRQIEDNETHKQSKTMISKNIEPVITTSITSVISNNSTDRDIALQNWIAKKEEERKKKLEKEKKLMEQLKKEKEEKSEREKKNFEQWLEQKKQKELEIKKKQKKQLKDSELKNLEKQKRQLENQLSFQLWRKQKEEQLLEKKIKEQTAIISELEKKKKKLVDNEKAFEEWLKNSKTRQKPVKTSLGIKSFCTSQTLSFINPNPWNPPT